jgi:tRNA G10  N-methylase Trm11
MKTLLCSIAQTLPAFPALDPMDAQQQLMVIDTGLSGCYLTKVLPRTRTVTQQSSILTEWARRPFQYSSAININVAEIVIDLLSDFTESTKRKVTMLDPTCGSGTFLAFAMAKGMRVEAFDCNPSCVDGSLRNLESLFQEEKVRLFATVQLHDSSNLWEEENGTEINCVVANLPWGVNSVEYLQENDRILRSVRARISTGIPCAFVTRDPDITLFTGAGFEVLGQAHVPQRDFSLPKGKKKRQSDDEVERNGRNRCVITIARSI